MSDSYENPDVPTVSDVPENGYSIEFLNNKTLQSSSAQLECKGFAKRLFQSPSDRHVYASKFFVTPVRYSFWNPPPFFLN
jgi:hypothetical protein